MITIIQKFIILVMAIPFLVGCLGIQDDYKYVPSNINNNVNMTAWGYINSRQDVFSSLKQAILYCGIDTTLYQQTSKKYTYLLLDNLAFTGSSSVLANANVTSITNMDKQILKNVLLYHIVDGYYTGLETLNFNPIFVITLWKSPLAVMTLELSNKPSSSYYSRLVINDMAGNSTSFLASTSNILTTNGVIAVLDRPAVYVP